MKILYISHRFPYPPDKGDKIRTFNSIEFLARENDVYLISLSHKKSDLRRRQDIKSYCSGVSLFYLNPFLAKIKAVLYLLLGKPASLGYFYSRRLKAKVDNLIRSNNFDLVFVRSSSMAQYVIDKNLPKIIDIGDCDSEKWRQYSKFARFPSSWIYNKEFRALRKYEQEISEKFNYLTVVSEFEKECFSAFLETKNFFVIPNGVDVNNFDYLHSPEGRIMVFAGTMDYLVNIDGVIYFCKEILPLIKNKIPDVKFYIIGRDPVYSVRALKKIEGVFVTGFVNDIKEYLRRASVFVAPLRMSQGIQNKILEAMSLGLPVVATSKALSGLRTEPNRDILAADCPEDFSNKVTMIVENSDLRERFGENARRYVKENHNWERNLVKLKHILDLVIK